MRARVRHVGLGLVLLCVAGTSFLGFLLKSQPTLAACSGEMVLTPFFRAAVLVPTAFR